MNYLLRILIISIISTVFIWSCSSSTESEEAEFVASLNDFQGYTSWTKVSTSTGPDPLLQAAHGATDPLTRNVFIKDDAKPKNDQYPVGTIIVKELRSEMGSLEGGLTMMVKRGADFNPDGDGWEWFMTSTDLTTVMTRGDNATAMDGMCASCHAGANVNNNGIDWVFSRKP